MNSLRLEVNISQTVMSLIVATVFQRHCSLYCNLPPEGVSKFPNYILSSQDDVNS